MKNFILMMLFCAALFSAACQKEEAKTPDQTKPENKTETTKPGTKPSNDPNLQATFPFKDFPPVETKAKAGEFVLVPSYNWLQDANTKGIEQTSMIWYSQKMSAPDKEMSEVEFMTGKKKVPNAYIIAIPAGGTAKKGDIVLTWWQSGSGMNRAIVVDDAKPSEPIVRYLDIDYDNPSKSRDGKTTIGQMDEQLKPNTFVKINAPMEPGTSIAIQDGGKQKLGKVITVAGDKVFVRHGVGKIAVFDKSVCTPIPIVPDVKAGDKVKVPTFSGFAEGTVSKVDEKIGRVFVKLPTSEKEIVAPFGDVIK